MSKQIGSANLKFQYKRVLELGLIVSLILHIFMLQAYKKVKVKTTVTEVKLEALQVEDIPQTQQQRSAPAPSRPTVPIASEDETLPEDETIEFTDLDLESEPPPPPPPPAAEESDMDDGIPVFVPFDEPPNPIGGYPAIQKQLKYPELARKAGVEGRVMVWAQIDVDGNVSRTRIMKSLGPNGCDEAAQTAIRAVKWKPAMQRDRPVKVWVAVPVDFRLK